VGLRQHPADRGEQSPVGRFPPGSWKLTAQDGELVAQEGAAGQVAAGPAAGLQDRGVHRRHVAHVDNGQAARGDQRVTALEDVAQLPEPVPQVRVVGAGVRV
jgi:hypothetical protein